MGTNLFVSQNEDWKQIGLKLGINETVLDQIADKYQSLCSSNEQFKKWAKRMNEESCKY